MAEFNPALLPRAAVEFYVNTGMMIKLPDNIPVEYQRRSGVFVSIKKWSNLRGCIGSIEPQTDNIAMEIVRNAVSAATRDPRFKPVSCGELETLSYSVDILSPKELVKSPNELDPKIYGVIVRAGMAMGLLLPDLDGVTTAAQQIAIAKQKAGIYPGAKVEIYRFRVQRISEDEE